MADIAESAPFTDPALAISQGKRHLLVRDYSMAVSALAQACQLLAEKHGDTADELGEPYLLYGRALLGLAREEAGVLGGGVPGSEEAEEDEEDEEEGEEDEKLSNVDEKEEEEEEEEEEERASNGASSEAKPAEESTENKTDDSKKAEAEPEKSDEKKGEVEAGSSDAKGKPEEGEKVAKVAKVAKVTKVDEANKTDDSKIAEQKAQDSKAAETEAKPGTKEEVTAGSSKETSHANGPSSSSAQNGDLKENGEDEGEDVNKDDDEDEVNNLQVAWEVLELAKLVLSKRGEAGSKLLADAYRLLGEVAMEGGNHQGALSDLHSCLDLLQKMEPRDARAIAEIHYQLALAHSLGNDFDSSIEEFNKATALLEARIKELEETKEPPKTDDSFYTVEGEIKELKELLPEIQEKISDMKDFKQEACRLVIEGIKSKVAGGCSNGAGPSSSDGSAGSSSSPKVQKPASDISHLVRKKRKADEPETEIASPCKKPTPEKAV